MNFSDIKLVIWDLDDTFWSGTLSEGEIKEDIRCSTLVRSLTNIGIVNSICSKNDFDITKGKLQELDVWDYFVFPSIDWTPKGTRVENIIKNVAFRPTNVLFLDDNPMNLQEVRHYIPEIMIGGPEIIEELNAWASDKSKWQDLKHKRLKQYKILEVKHSESQKFSSNEDFLMASNIRVEIHYDCANEIDRIHELLMRSNQLNFTKKRISFDELHHIIDDEKYECGYVSVKDNYGDYGIVGFYAKTNNSLEHFLFSCRTMGLHVEQYVYAEIGFPSLEVIGSVATNLNTYERPKWVNQEMTSNVIQAKAESDYKGRILIKGPCDLLQAKAYLKINDDCVDTEFTYISDKGVVMDAYNHHIPILGSILYSETEKREILEDFPSLDKKALYSQFFSTRYDIIFLSTLIESTYGIYKKIGTEIKVVLGHIDSQICNDNYEYLGLSSPTEYVNFLKTALSLLPKETRICLILGVESDYGFNDSGIERHKTLNDAIRHLANQEDRISYIDINNFVSNRNDFGNSINHFSARVYYQIAEQMTELINKYSAIHSKSQPKYLLLSDVFLNAMKKCLSWTVKGKTNLYTKFIKKTYRKLARKERQ